MNKSLINIKFKRKMLSIKNYYKEKYYQRRNINNRKKF